MAIVWFDPVDITPGTADTWVDVDVSDYVPASQSGVILHFKNSSTNRAHDVAWTKNGSTDNRQWEISTNAHFWTGCGVDANSILELFVENIDDVAVYLVGYIDSNATFFTNAVDVSLGATGSFLDIDISGDTGGDTSIGAFLEIIVTSPNYYFNVRKNGSTDDRFSTTPFFYRHLGAIIGVDGSEIFEGAISNTAIDFFLIGYFTSDATFNTNATDMSLAGAGSWTDLAALPVGANGGFFEVSPGSTYTYGFRRNGVTENITGKGGVRLAWAMISSDSNRVVEGIISNTGADFFLTGYPTGGNTNFNSYSSPSAQDLTLALQTPTIDVGIIDYTATPSVQSLALTQQTPAINYDYALDVSAQSLSLTPQTPGTKFDYKLGVNAQALTLAFPAPTLAIGPVVTPSALSLALSLQTPTPEFDYNFDVSTQSLTATLNASNIKYDWKESVSSQSLATSLKDPTVTLSGSVSPSALALNLTLQTPTAGPAVIILPSALELNLNLLTAVGGETGGYQPLDLGWGHQDFRHSGKPEGISLFWKGHIADEKHHEPRLSEYSGISENLAELAERVIPTRGQTGPNVNAPLTPKMPHIKRHKDNLLAMYLRGQTLHNKTLFNRIGRQGAKVGDGVESTTDLLHKWKEAHETKS